MRKKILAMLLCLVTALGCAFGFTACGGGGDTGDGGNGDDKTEQTTPNEKPGNDDDKKPDNSDENKTDDKKGDDEKEPDGSDDDKTVDQAEAFKAITDALQAKLDDEYGDGAEILSICNLGLYLGCKVSYNNAVKTVRTSAQTKNWLDDNGNIFDYDKANRLIENSTLRELDGEFVGLYLSDSESTMDKAFVKEMIENRVGTDCDI
ncbi:MAG: hypothetical protein K2I17_06040, partial [Clostridia bacterium]|nr:hypothetical protein [Clostridia bacterium]